MRVPAGGEGQAAASEEREGSAPEPAAGRGHRRTAGAERSRARGKRAGIPAGRTEMGPGTGRPSGAGAQALNPRGRIPGAACESGSWSGRSRRSDHVPPGCPELEGGRHVRTLTGGTGTGQELWIPGLHRWYPTFLSAPGEPPRGPQTLQFLKVAKRPNAGGGWGAADSPPSPLPLPAVPQRCGGAHSSPVPVVRTGCSGGSGNRDPRPVNRTPESSDSVLIETCQAVSWGQSAAG